MAPSGFTLFDTAIGRCGIAWGEQGLLCVQLPEGDERRTRARLRRQVPGATEAVPPVEVWHTIDRIAAAVGGALVDLDDVVLDTRELPGFHRRVYEITRTIPPGSTLSYAAVATRLGSRDAARAVGRALGQNPWPLVVPCHRVVGSGGWSGGFSAHGGVATKLRLLRLEGAAAGGHPTLFDGV